MIFLDYFSFILNKTSKQTLYKFFYNNQVYLNNDELDILYNYIKKHQNSIKNNNFQSYLFSRELKLNIQKKEQIYKTLKRFI